MALPPHAEMQGYPRHEIQMECREPGAIRDDELVAYFNGEPTRPAVFEHLAQCQACSSRLATYQRIELKLVNTLYRWDCPSSQLLGEYQLELLSPAQMITVRQHLAQCVLCSAEAASLSSFLSSDSLLEERSQRASARPSEFSLAAIVPTSHVIHETQQMVKNWQEKVKTAARRIVAELMPLQPGLAGVRHIASKVEPWPRRYRTEKLQIFLQLKQGASQSASLQLLGLVTHQGTNLGSLEGVHVCLVPVGADTKALHQQAIDELGNFVFTDLSPAIYELELRFSQEVVVIEQLPIHFYGEE
ncbi:hypothetical protein [Tengunoibacter tsumagoiensis]|uniref:Zinc-finger domain-containing protein n=1 Tax=Tengunoibacter tsumagoiensis TaxID=2014871 RepID=A0A401ZZU5_9CHLR|nr:hypothetical protein [Tengunoibacter tsumagoiensis]GCE12349.1 hypothetical protein KTT_22080 [Tengunoibacter tsumagoiensis]